jgi:hypothetical protein
MEVEYAFLADAAQSSSDGKLYVLGGGFDEIRAAKFPAVHPQMALVLKLSLHPSECEREHKTRIELWDADGNRVGPQLDAAFVAARRTDRPASDVYVQLVLNMLQTQFPKPGMYGFQISVDERHLKTVSLGIIQTG